MHVIATVWIGIILNLIALTLSVDPKFDPSTRMRLVLVPADATVGSVIYRLRATDDEFDYPLQFELMGDTSSSTVQIETLPCTKYNSVCQANVVLTRRLEPGRYYDFQVSVKDTKGGTAMQSCSITATNFTTPHDIIFPHKTGIIMVSEDAKRGTELDYITSKKNPLFQKPVYLELWGSPLFAIRQKIVSPEMTEGTIFLLGPLDFEKQAMYHLTVLANDAYAEPGQDSRNIAGMEIVIIVEDVQDVPPVFTVAPPVTRLPAGLIPGDKVLQVHAEDGDKGVPREIRYGLVSEGNPFTSFFDINETSGEISLLRPLDDISALTHVGDPVLLTVIAEEVKVTRDEPAAMATTVQLAFFLPERSNSPPYFENDHYVSRIEENAQPGTALIFPDPYITRVNDDDAGKNGVFSLTLIGNNGTFEISPNVAERSAMFVIRVRDNQMLDFETTDALHFQILAQELGPATNLSAIVNVTVYITDTNDNAPVFSETEYRATLPENMTVGTRVVQVSAEDIDTGMGGRIRYTQILGYLNTSLNLDAATGLVTVSTNNHGFDREAMPEYHLYIEARDNEGIGNRAQIPLIIQLTDVNDETPIFEKSLYEFILTPDLRNFTIPAFVKALDNDAEEPNNIVRYELIYGNYENKFQLNEVTGQLTLREPLMKMRPNNARNRRQTANENQRDSEAFVLTARAFDLGVPVRWSATTIRVYPPESRTRTVSFVVPGLNPDRQKIEETLAAITGGRVIIQDIRPYTGTLQGVPDVIGNSRDRSIVMATVLYDSDSVVDIAKIQQRLSTNGTINNIIIRDDSNSATLYKAENKVLFWLLIFLALLLALGILTLLLCCICPWCPLYAATRKRVIRVNSTEDDVHLVHREQGIGKQLEKSVQVAEWMGRREAWSAERSSDSRTKPTRWEFSRRRHLNETLGHDNSIQIDDEDTNIQIKKQKDKQSIKMKSDKQKDTIEKQKLQQTTVITDRDVFIEDVDEPENQTEYPSVSRLNPNKDVEDDDSMRRHEMDRGSDIDYNNRKRQTNDDHNLATGREQLFIKEGNAEILRLITRGRNEEENIYVNVPPRQQQPQYIMVDNSGGGKEILMRRYIEEQSNGKQVIREHYQLLPGATQTYIQQPTELLPSQANSNIYQQSQPEHEVKVIHTHAVQNAAAGNAPSNLVDNNNENQLSHALSHHSLIQQELENSLKQQNALLRQILLEKEKLEEKYNLQETAMETQSLPGHSLAIATQTDCESSTQTDPMNMRLERRRTRSENDDSMSEDEYEYVRYSPPNSPEGVYWIKRRRHRKKSKYTESDKGRKKIVTVEAVKRKIRTPIQEENEEAQQKTPQLRRAMDTKTSMMRRLKNEGIGKNERLKKDILLEISDSLMDEKIVPKINDKRKNFHEVYKRNVKYYEENSDSDRENEHKKIYYSADSLEGMHTDEEVEERVRISTKSTSKSTSVSPAPKVKPRVSRPEIKSSKSERQVFKRQTASEPPNRPGGKGPAPKPPDDGKTKKDKHYSDSDMLQRLKDEAYEIPKGVPKYMEWYFQKNKDDEIAKKLGVEPVAKDKEKEREKEKEKEKEREKEREKEKEKEREKERMQKAVVAAAKAKAASERVVDAMKKKKAPLVQSKSEEKLDEIKTKPEPLPRTSPPKESRMLKEEIQLAKKVTSQAAPSDSNHHQLLQHSEHRFEHEYDPAPSIAPQPSKLPHYLYPHSPPVVTRGETSKCPMAMHSPIKENEVKDSKSKIPLESSKTLNAATLEDDHDSGIAMNSLLNNMGRRNPIAEKKSVFSIAYDDVRIKQIRSESDSPPF